MGGGTRMRKGSEGMLRGLDERGGLEERWRRARKDRGGDIH